MYDNELELSVAQELKFYVKKYTAVCPKYLESFHHLYVATTLFIFPFFFGGGGFLYHTIILKVYGMIICTHLNLDQILFSLKAPTGINSFCRYVISNIRDKLPITTLETKGSICFLFENHKYIDFQNFLKKMTVKI